MKTLLNHLFVFVLVSCLSCTPEGRVFEEHQELSPDVEWLRTDAKTFSVPVSDINSNYDLSVTFRYANGYPYTTANLKMTMTTPSGEVYTEPVMLQVRGEDGTYIGSAGYDIWDSTHPMITPTAFGKEEGTYLFTFTHAMSKDVLPFAMELGMIVDKAPFKK